MAYPASVNAKVDGFDVTDGQDMNFQTGSNPPSYEKDPNDTTPYDYISLKRNAAGTNWELVVYDNGKFFQGSRDPVKDDPTGNYADSGSQTAVVKTI
ncbi:MAG: hypothetical protein GVY24_01865 [Planctomycetes bacterium]|jgi:sarcosine oxidase delta subunit|nr:hypothetical protein [Planctomycetota bacterium]